MSNPTVEALEKKLVEGLKFKIESSELAKLMKERAAYHEGRAATKKEELPKLKESLERPEVVLGQDVGDVRHDVFGEEPERLALVLVRLDVALDLVDHVRHVRAAVAELARDRRGGRCLADRLEVVK